MLFFFIESLFVVLLDDIVVVSRLDMLPWRINLNLKSFEVKFN